MGSLGDELVASGCVVQPEQKRVATSSSNVKRYCRSFTRTSLFLQQRSSNTAVLLADTLAFRNQGVAQQQNESVVLLTKAAVFITVITLVYLPWTLVTGVFGMEFFEMDPQTHGLKVSPQIWIYFATAVCASILTVTLYYVISWFWRDRINPNRPGRDQVGSFVPLCLQRGYTDIEKVAQMTEVQPART
ncbi:hypothetical protein NX059_010571 [Plenodomus lindquistii]|nr:hypothetical protein NX059_010571 [Plenodomus lindquistii]